MLVSLHVRTAMPEDVDAIAAIYAPYVLHGVASFEVDVPEPAEILRRRAAIVELGLPYVVAEIGAEIAGYSYATRFRPRAANRFTVESPAGWHVAIMGWQDSAGIEFTSKMFAPQVSSLQSPGLL
jgi:L-amino acid N-acyltransferase YncA